MNKKRLFGYLFVLVSVGNISAQESRLSAQEYKLWYDRPAQVWTEALPLGNGRLGAMVYGTPATEQIQLNEETIWAGRPNNNANPNALEYIPRVRDLVFAGKFDAADLQNLGSEARKLEHFLKADRVKPAGLALNTGVRRIDAVHVRKDKAFLRL